MSINKKIYMIQQNKEAAIAALNNYLDYIYHLHDLFFEENDQLKEGLERDEQAENLILSTKDQADRFENIRQKLINDDFNLSLTEINYIALGFLFSSIRMKKRIKDLETANRELVDLIQILFEGSEVNLKEIIN